MIDILGASLTVSDSAIPFEGGYTWVQINPESIFDKTILNDKTIFTIGEAACAFRLPDPPMENEYGVPVRNYRTALAKLPITEYTKNSIVLFDNEHQHYRQPVIMPLADRLRHCFIIMQTGMRKSHLMTGMICQDIEMGRGGAVIDPHGDMVDDVLGRIPKKRVKDVILFDMLDRDQPIGFNLLQWETEEERDLIIDEIYTAVDHVYDLKQTGGPIFESNMRGVLRLLMSKKTGKFISTIIELPKFYLKETRKPYFLYVDEA
jgi:hypothetical protein